MRPAGALRVIGDAALGSAALRGIFARLNAGRLAVLAYHEVGDPEAFGRHLDEIRRARHPISAEDLLQSLRGGTLPARATLITFDDGYPSVMDVALPLLRERGMPAVVFVVAGLLDTEQPFWWMEAQDLVARGASLDGVPPGGDGALVSHLKRVPDAARLQALEALRRQVPSPSARARHLARSDLAVLESAGITVGNHSLTHPCLDRCPPAKITEEVARSHEILTAALGHEPRLFAYPNGGQDPGVVRVVAEAGYHAGFLFDHRMEAVPPRDPLRISRLRVDGSTRSPRFRAILSGAHPSVHHLLGRP